MRQKRIAQCATGLAIAVVVFCVIWTVEYTMRLSQNVFTVDWSSWEIVDDHVTVTGGKLALAAAFYAPVFLASWLSFFWSIRLMLHYRVGRIFDEAPARALMWLGGSLIAVSLVDTYIYAFELRLYTLWNEVYRAPIRYFYDAGDITIAFAGVGFWIVGWITREGVRMREENEAFI